MGKTDSKQETGTLGQCSENDRHGQLAEAGRSGWTGQAGGAFEPRPGAGESVTRLRPLGGGVPQAEGAATAQTRGQVGERLACHRRWPALSELAGGPVGRGRECGF